MRPLIFCFIATMMIGCSSSPEGKVTGVSEANGYSFTLLGNEGGGIMNRFKGNQLEVVLGEHVVGIDQESGKLAFDNKEAGMVAKGDKIIVDARGWLFVNGKPR